MPDGKSIVTGWSDGKLRAFTPQKGKLLYLIKDAHTVKSHEGTPQHKSNFGFTKGVACLSTG
jgi:WD40 repeat protein